MLSKALISFRAIIVSEKPFLAKNLIPRYEVRKHLQYIIMQPELIVYARKSEMERTKGKVRRKA